MAKVKQRKGIRSGGATRSDSAPPARAASGAKSRSAPAPTPRTATAARGKAQAKRAAVSAVLATRNGKAGKKPAAGTRAAARATTGGRASAAAVKKRAAPASGPGGRRKGTSPVTSDRGSRAPVVPDRVVKIKELDPMAKCGPSTSVVHLYRVDESLNGLVATHLVFFDRHGWYCEHGRGCRAVEDVRKVVKTVPGKSLARTIQVG